MALCDFETVARERTDRMAWEYICGGAADEITLRWNREAFDHLRLNPRVLRDVSKVETAVRLLGTELPFPVMVAPCALHKLVHPDGELATARGIAEAGTVFTLSTMSSVTLEEVAAGSTSPKWFQLYAQTDKGVTRELVARAEAAGYKALVVTVDTPALGVRNREMRCGFHLPPGMELANLSASKRSAPTMSPEHSFFQSVIANRLTWDDIAWLQGATKLPIVLKGILNAEDADLAVRNGVAALQVSNHGGRNLDTVPATIDALPRIADKVGGRIPLLLDGGIRRGTDVLKAMACGATAVLIGRPAYHGLAVGGAAGVTKVLNILRTEFEMAMALSGCATISDIDSGVLWT